MKKYNKNILALNKKIINNTKKLSYKVYDKNMKIVNKLVHPPKNISWIGSMIGMGIGISLLIIGLLGLILDFKIWIKYFIIIGIITIVSNIVNLKKSENLKY